MGETRARLGIERLPDTARRMTQCSSGLAQPCRLSGAIKAATGTAGPPGTRQMDAAAEHCCRVAR